MNSTNGLRQDQSTTYSSKRSSDFLNFGLNSSRSTKFQSLIIRLAFGVVAGAGDVGVKLGAWQWIYGGTHSPQDFADYNSFKHLTCAIMAFGPTCWTGIPFENARRAYFADRSWPLELRRGYKSPLNALLRIPFEEGPSYLFKGGFPIWTS
jgi:solute carrier family 25 (mitochondrial oxoglutarate transporter), member 11